MAVCSLHSHRAQPTVRHPFLNIRKRAPTPMPSRFEYERAVRSSTLPGLSRLVLFTLATWADVKTGIIPDQLNPSLTVLAEGAGMDRSTVRRHLNALEEAGWVGRKRPKVADARAEKARTHYRLTLPKGVTVPDSEGIELGAQDPKAGGTLPLDGSELGAQDPQPRGTLPLELGALCTTTRGTVPLSSSLSPTTSKEDLASQTRAPAPADAIPEVVRPLIDGLTASGVTVRWPFHGDQWTEVADLVAKCGTQALIDTARKIAAKYDPDTARYFLRAWGELPALPPPDAERPPLRSVSGSTGGYQTYRARPSSDYENDTGRF